MNASSSKNSTERALDMLPGFLGFHIKVINCILKRFNLFQASSIRNKLLETSPKSPIILQNIKMAQIANIFVRSIQFTLLICNFNYENSVTGDEILRLFFSFMISYCFHLACSFLREKHLDFVYLFNKLFQSSIIINIRFVKFMFYNTPIVSILVILLYTVLSIFNIIDPVTREIENLSKYWLSIILLLRVIMILFETGCVTFACLFGPLIFYIGMFGSYICLFEMTNKLCKIILKNSKKTCYLYSNLNLSTRYYHKLQILTNRVNNCYQEEYALYVKPLFIGFGIAIGTVLIEEKLRTNTSTVGLLLAGYCLINSYIFMAIGYYYPGKVHAISERILYIHQIMLGTMSNGKGNVKSRRECKCIVKACRSIRILIGMDNYYDQTTALNLLEFLASQTMNVVLLI